MSEVTACFVFLDLEATGLLVSDKARSGRITEIAMLAVSRRDLEAGGRTPVPKRPRVKSRLCLPVNPGEDAHWSPEAIKISGLSPSLVSDSCSLGFLWPNVLAFLRSAPKPLVLLAHNGDRFDFPLLRDEMRRCGLKEMPNGVFTLDTLDLFKLADSREEALLRSVDDILDEEATAAVEAMTSTTPPVPIVPDAVVTTPSKESLVEAGVFWSQESAGLRVATRYSINGVPQPLHMTPKRPAPTELPPTPTGPRKAAGSDMGETTPKLPRVEGASRAPRRELFGAGRSYALGSLHARLLGGPVPNAHEAAGDVEALLSLTLAYGFDVPGLVDAMRKPWGAY